MVCDKVLSRAREMEMMDMVQVHQKKLQLLERLHGLLEKMDSNRDGKIDSGELKMAMRQDPEVMALIDSIDLPGGFSADELVLLLDSDGDGLLSYDSFIRSFYRLIDGGDFQQLCLLQMNMHTIKHQILETKQHTMKMQEQLATIQLEDRSLGGNKADVADMTPQTWQKFMASATDATEPQQSVAEELGEPSEDEDNYEDVHDRCSHWHQSLASMEDTTAQTRLELSRSVEQVSAALLEAENLHALVLSSPRASSKVSTRSTRSWSPSRSSAAHSKGRSHSPSVARRTLTSPLRSNQCSKTSKVTCKGGPDVEEYALLCL